MKCTPITQDTFEKTKLDKVLPKLLKRGNENVKSLVQAVLDHITKASKNKANVSEKVTAQVGLAGGEKTDASSAARQEADLGTGKKTTIPASQPRASTTLGKGLAAAKPNAALKPNGKPSESNDAKASPVTAKPITAQPSLFSGLLSASKKPGTSMASQKAAKASEAKKPSKPKEDSSKPAEQAPPKPAFSFAEAIASLNKPKETEPRKRAADSPPETEEDRKKRLRREARRHLRVRWKSEATLVETKLFTHDPEEELELDHDMVRADLRNEGKMLKAGLGKSVEEEEEEEELAEGIELMPWRGPSQIDFVDLQSDMGTATNFSSRGGTEQARSAETGVQRNREMNTLIAIYTSKSDIPESPREPSEPFAGKPSQEVAFGELPEKLKVSFQEPNKESTIDALAKLSQIRDAEFRRKQSQQPAPQPYQPAGTNPTANISSLLQILNSGQQQPTQSISQPTPQAQPALESIFSHFSGLTGQIAPPHQQPAPQAQSTPQIDPQILAALNMFNQQQNQVPAPYNPAPSVPQTSNLSNILAQISQPQQQTPSNLPQNFNYQNQYQQDSRKRPYDGGQQRGYDQGNDNKRGKGNRSGKQVSQNHPCITRSRTGL